MPVDLTTFFVIALLLTITPGVDTVLVLRNGVARGTWGGLATATGICSGLLVHAFLSAVGLSVILSQSATAYHALRLAGAVYLLWLGGRLLWNSLRHRTRTGVDERPRPAPAAASPAASFSEGLLNNLLNPKVVLFYLAIVPQFVPAGGSIVSTSLLLGGIHALMGLVWLGALAGAAGRARTWFARPRVGAWLDRCSGAVLVAFGARVAMAD